MLNRDEKHNYSGPESHDSEPRQETPEERAQRRAARRKAASDKMLTFLTAEPPPSDFVWRGFLRGTVGGIVAAGSTGKSYYAIEAAMCVASAKANARLLKLDIPAHGRVAIINAEDPEKIIWERIHAIGKFLDKADYRAMCDNIEIVSLFGRTKTDMNDFSFVLEMLEYAEETRLVVFDTFNRFAGEADENSNGEMGLLLKSYEYIASHTNAGVLFLHHSNKVASANGKQHMQESARGASAITSNLRWQAYMQGMTEDEAAELGIPEEDRHSYVRFGGNKENYGEKTPGIWLQRHDKGVLLPMRSPEERKAQSEAAMKSVNDAVAKGDAAATQVQEDMTIEGIMQTMGVSREKAMKMMKGQKSKGPNNAQS